MTEEEKEKQKAPSGFNWDHLNDMLNYGMGAGSRDSVDAFRMAFQNGLIGKGPPLTPLDPFEFPVKPLPSAEPRSKQDLADAKIAELEGQLRRESVERQRQQVQAHRLQAEVQQLRAEKLALEGKLALERVLRDRSSVPVIITKYLKFLIFACHPDRNPGRVEAVEVTKALLDLRRK